MIVDFRGITIGGRRFKIFVYDSKKYDKAAFVPLRSYFNNEKEIRGCLEYIEKYYNIGEDAYCNKVDDNDPSTYMSLNVNDIYVKVVILQSYISNMKLLLEQNNIIKDKMDKKIDMTEQVKVDDMNMLKQTKPDDIIEENINDNKKMRSDNIHQTYAAIMKFYNNLLEEKEIRQFTKEDTKNEVKRFFALKEGEKIDDVFIGKAFDNFWKNFPEKYKVGPGNPNYKNK